MHKDRRLDGSCRSYSGTRSASVLDRERDGLMAALAYAPRIGPNGHARRNRRTHVGELGASTTLRLVAVPASGQCGVAAPPVAFRPVIVQPAPAPLPDEEVVDAPITPLRRTDAPRASVRRSGVIGASTTSSSGRGAGAGWTMTGRKATGGAATPHCPLAGTATRRSVVDAPSSPTCVRRFLLACPFGPIRGAYARAAIRPSLSRSSTDALRVPL